jgi:hypothetical protein
MWVVSEAADADSVARISARPAIVALRMALSSILALNFGAGVIVVCIPSLIAAPLSVIV